MNFDESWNWLWLLTCSQGYSLWSKHISFCLITFLLTHSTHNIKTLNRPLNHENNTYFERICHTRIVFDMPFEKSFVSSKMWDPVSTRFLILRNEPPNFNFAFAWRKKNQKSGIINQKSEIRWQNHKSKLKQITTWFQLWTPKSKIQNQILDIKYRTRAIITRGLYISFPIFQCKRG